MRLMLFFVPLPLFKPFWSYGAKFKNGLIHIFCPIIAINLNSRLGILRLGILRFRACGSVFSFAVADAVEPQNRWPSLHTNREHTNFRKNFRILRRIKF